MNYAARAGRYFEAMRFQHRLLLPVFPLVLLGGCKKDDPGEPPTISILAPGDGSTLTVPDTLTATVRLSDDVSVEHVSIALVDANGAALTPGFTVTPGSNPATITVQLPVTSERIEGGNCTLLATATDGNNDAHASRSIHVVPVPLRLRSIFAVTSTGATVGLSRIDSLGQVSAAASWPMDLGGAAVSSADQLLYVCGSSTGSLTAIAPDDHAVQWERPVAGPAGTPYFSALSFGGDTRPYVGCSDGFLRGFNAATGMGEFTASLPTDRRADQVLRMGELVVCTMHHIATQQAEWVAYQHSSGVQAGGQLLDLAPVALFQRTDDAFLLFGNMAGHGVLEEKSLSGGGGWSPYTWPQPITAVGRVDSGHWLVALTDGSLCLFTYASAASITTANLPDVRDLQLDPLSGLLYAAAGTQVVAINSVTGLPVASYAIGSDVHYVLPLFNR